MCGPGLGVATAVETTREYKQKPAAAAAIQNSKIQKSEKVYSKDPCMTVKIFCCQCDKVVPLSSMKSHTKSQHKITLTEYKELYGNPRKQIIKLVYHKCALCKNTFLFDPSKMYKHLKKNHQMSYKQYSTKYLGQQPTQSLSTPSQDTSRRKEASQQEPSAVIIRCDQCDKTFRQNIQLKIHKKKHSL